MSDHRIEAAARAIAASTPGDSWPSNGYRGGSPAGTRHESGDAMLDTARDALAAADAADAEQGIYRVTVDDEAVEAVAATLGNFYYRGEEFDVRDYMRPARQVLAALTRERSDTGRGDKPGAAL